MISGHFRRFHAFPSSGFPKYFVIWHDDYNDYDYDYYYDYLFDIQFQAATMLIAAS